MYCPNCGAESTLGLKFCKRCGASIASSADTTAPQKFPVALTAGFVGIIGLIALVGLIAPLALATDLIKQGITLDNLRPILFLSPVVTFGIVGALIWLLLRLIKIYQHPGGQSQIKEVQAEGSKAYTPAQIAAPPESLGSVTEHTTRNFDPSRYRDAEGQIEDR
jgi:hypothetical protein